MLRTNRFGGMYSVALVTYSACVLNILALGLFGYGSGSVIFLLGTSVVLTGVAGVWTLLYKGKVAPVARGVKDFPIWLFIFGFVGVALAAWRLPSLFGIFDLGAAFSSANIKSESWYQDGEKYFILINKNELHELTQQQFDVLNEKLYEFISVPFLILSFAGVLTWRAIAHRIDERL